MQGNSLLKWIASMYKEVLQIVVVVRTQMKTTKEFYCKHFTTFVKGVK